MKTVETTATVAADGTLTVRAPAGIAPGEHRVVLVIEEQPVPGDQAGSPPADGAEPFDFPVHDLGPWPEGLSLRREDMYDDWGR